MDDFLHRELRATGQRVHRLGIACNYGIDAAGLEHAFERGINYVFWTQLRTGGLKNTVRAALQRHRDRVVLATGPSLAYFGGSVRRAAERTLKTFGIDRIDVFQLFWLGRMSAWSNGTVEELLKLKEEGKVRAIGISIHDRPRAGRLAEDSPLDLLMLRYNAAHPGAEREVFPHLKKRQPSVVAYTATSWRRLLKKPAGWDGPAMSAGDCYRFCLSSPHVDLVLCGAADRRQLDENLAALEKGPLSLEEAEWMRRYGQAVHG
ncbi:MAG: aldo/keto reductase [Myxococcales bacterium]